MFFPCFLFLFILFFYSLWQEESAAELAAAGGDEAADSVPSMHSPSRLRLFNRKGPRPSSPGASPVLSGGKTRSLSAQHSAAEGLQPIKFARHSTDGATTGQHRSREDLPTLASSSGQLNRSYGLFLITTGKLKVMLTDNESTLCSLTVNTACVSRDTLISANGHALTSVNTGTIQAQCFMRPVHAGLAKGCMDHLFARDDPATVGAFWREVARVELALSVRLRMRFPRWERDSQEQLRYLRFHDVNLKRLPFLYNRSGTVPFSTTWVPVLTQEIASADAWDGFLRHEFANEFPVVQLPLPKVGRRRKKQKKKEKTKRKNEKSQMI